MYKCVYRIHDVAKRVQIALIKIVITTEVQYIAKIQQIVFPEKVPAVRAAVNGVQSVGHVLDVAPKCLRYRTLNGLVAAARRVRLAPSLGDIVARARGDACAGRWARADLLLVTRSCIPSCQPLNIIDVLTKSCHWHCLQGNGRGLCDTGEALSSIGGLRKRKTRPSTLLLRSRGCYTQHSRTNPQHIGQWRWMH